MNQEITVNNNKKNCPVTYTIQLIGGKWKPMIIGILMSGTKRFSELRKEINLITEKMLTQQLRELEKDGIFERKIYAEVPPKVEYKLTSLRFSLKPILDSMLQWGLENMKGK
ncbi:winged helix-turn-helix transcriptional regulator [soil metagenome]